MNSAAADYQYLTAATSDLKPTCRDTRGTTSSGTGGGGGDKGDCAVGGSGGGADTGKVGGGPGSLTNDQFLKSVSFWRSWRKVCQAFQGVVPA